MRNSPLNLLVISMCNIFRLEGVEGSVESPSCDDAERAIASGGFSSSPSSLGPTCSSHMRCSGSCSPKCPSLPQAVAERLSMPPAQQPSRSQSQPSDLPQVNSFCKSVNCFLIRYATGQAHVWRRLSDLAKPHLLWSSWIRVVIFCIIYY